MPNFHSNHSQAKVAVVGFSARSAALSAHKASYIPVAVDFCADRDLIALCAKHFPFESPDSITELAREFGNMPVLMTGGMEHRLPLVQALLKAGMTLGCDASVIEHMRSTSHWSRWASASGLLWPKTLDSSDDFADALVIDPSARWLIKSRQGVGGMSVRQWGTPVAEQLRGSESVTAFLPQMPGHYFQQFLPGDSIGVSFLSSSHGTVILGAAQSIGQDTQIFMPEFTYRGSCGPIKLTDEQIQKLESFSSVVGHATGFLGLWQADFIRQGSGQLSLLEINPRWSASMEILDVFSQEKLVDQHIRCITHSMSKQEWRELVSQRSGADSFLGDRMLGKLIVYATGSFSVTLEQSDWWWERRWHGEPDWTSSEIVYADIPKAGTPIAKGEPVMTCIAHGSSVTEIVQRLVRHRIL